MEKYLNVAIEAVRIASNEINAIKNNFTVNFKDINDLVTDADIISEKTIKNIIKKEFPNHKVLGEESDHSVDKNSDNLWIIDPLDGTNNFANNIPQYSISIAYTEKGIVKLGVVYDPSKDELFYATLNGGAYLNEKKIITSNKKELSKSIICTGFYYDRGELMEKTLDTIKKLFHLKIRGLRRFGSAAIDLCWVACGRFDGYFEYQLNCWDFAAGMLIVKEANGSCVNIDGKDSDLNSEGLIVSTLGIKKEFCNIVKWDRSK